MGNSYEEADVIVVNQVMSAASQGYKTIHIVCDNTDVFVLLVHFYKTLNITSELLMVPSSTTRKHDELLPHILPLHYSANRQEMSKSWHNVVIVVNNVVINMRS